LKSGKQYYTLFKCRTLTKEATDVKKQLNVGLPKLRDLLDIRKSLDSKKLLASKYLSETKKEIYIFLER